MLHTIQQRVDHPGMIFSDQVPDTLLKRIRFLREYNIRNISAMNLFRHYLEKNDVSQLHQSYEMNPYNADISFRLGKISAEIEKPREAEKYFRQSLIMHQDHVDATYNLGLMLLKQGIPDSALHYFYETIRLKPDHTFANNTLGVLLAQKEEYEKAIGYFSHALKGNPNYKPAQENREKAIRKLQTGD